MQAVWLVIFWLSAATLGYVYLGYPLILALWAAVRPRPPRSAEGTPTIDLIIPAYNEAGCIIAKLENSLALSYPPEKTRILVVTDGSVDGTERLAASFSEPRIRVLHQPERRGKSAALARAVAAASSAVLVFTDANAMLEPGALQALVRPLADPAVAAVGGVKRVRGSNGEGHYWRYENSLKRWESAVGSVMGVPGELWAVRANLYQPPPPDTILDDFTASMRLVTQGWRVAHAEDAVAYEGPPSSLAAAWERRVRNAAGGWQAIIGLGGPGRFASTRAWWQCWSHRSLRWMAAPWLWLPLLASSLALSARPFYLAVGIAQGIGYALAAVGALLAHKRMALPVFNAAFYLLFTNAAAAAGGWRYVTGRQNAMWQKAR